MPPPRYERSRVLRLGEAWELLKSDPTWELAERYAGGRVKVGTPAIKPKSQVGGVGIVVTSKNAAEGHTGVRIEVPQGPAGAFWADDKQAALDEFETRLRVYGEQVVGDERMYRIELVVDHEVIDQRILATGELSPDPEVLDGLSLTYIGVLASIALAFAFGIQDLGWWMRALVAGGAFFALALLLRDPRSQRWITRFSRWALPGSHGSTA